MRKKKIKGEKKILFLDFDGVLNNVGFFLTKPPTPGMFLEVKETFKNELDPHNVKLINYILEQVPELEIIISSSWGHKYNRSEIRKGLVYGGLKKEHAKRIIDITPKRMSSERLHEVTWALRDLHEDGWTCDLWLTLDDHSIFPTYDPDDMFGKWANREIKTSPLNGVTIGDAWQIIKYFKPDFDYPRIYL